MVLLACAWSVLLGGCDRPQAVQVRFKPDVGATALQRLQFYVSDVELLQPSGEWRPLALSASPPWQGEHVALLDLDSRSDQGRTQVEGTIDAGMYTGVRFSVGVPFKLNHSNVLTANAPLNRAELFWTWQSGYKFLRLELTDEQHAGAFHLGSTGCSSASALRPPQQPCARPNVMRVELRGFDPLRQAIEVRVADIVAALQQSARAACTGDYEREAGCASAFMMTGLDVRTGKCTGADGICSAQRLFAVPAAADKESR